MHKRILAVTLSIVAWVTFPIAQAAELHVGPGQTYVTIMDAISAAAEGDFVTVHDNATIPDYQETIVIDTRNLTLREAEGEDVAIKSINYWENVILVTANKVTIEGFDMGAALLRRRFNLDL